MPLDVQLMGPVAALSRGLHRTRVSNGRIRPVESELTILRRGFSMGGRGFVVEANLLLEVLDAPGVFPLPNGPRSCRGLINLRGSLVPVFDIRRAMGGEGGSYRWVMVMDKGEQAAAFVIDRLPIQIKLTESNRLDGLPDVDELAAEAVSAAYRVDEELYFMMDHKKLLERLTQQS